MARCGWLARLGVLFSEHTKCHGKLESKNRALFSASSADFQSASGSEGRLEACATFRTDVSRSVERTPSRLLRLSSKKLRVFCALSCFVVRVNEPRKNEMDHAEMVFPDALGVGIR